MNTKNTNISTKVPHRFAEPLDRGNNTSSPYLGGAEERGGGTVRKGGWRGSRGFTLVELIVVITILTILGTIAFVQLGGFSRSARDGTRVTDMASLTKAMDLSYIKSSIYPAPSNGSGITYSGGIVWTQWTIGDSVITMLSSSNTKLSKKPTDPKYPTIEYTYSLLNTGKEYQIGTAMEESSVAYNPLNPPYQGEISELLPWQGEAGRGFSLIPQAHAATESLTAYLRGNYNGLVARVQTGSSPNITTYYLALPSITLKDLSGSTSLELSNSATASGNLVLHKKGNIPSSYTQGQIQTPTSSNFVTSLLQTSTGIVAYSTTASALDSTGVTAMMTALYNTYSGSNLRGDSTSASQVASLITGGSATGALTDLYNGIVSKSVGGSVVASQQTPPPVTPTCTSWTYSTGACQPGNTQTLTIATSLPSGCTGGTPLTSQVCTYVPPALITQADCTTAGWIWNPTADDVYIGSTQWAGFCISPIYGDWNTDSALGNGGISWNGWGNYVADYYNGWNATGIADSLTSNPEYGQTKRLDSEVTYNCKSIGTASSDYVTADTIVGRMKWLATTGNSYAEARSIDWITGLVPHTVGTNPHAIPALYIADCIDGVKDLTTTMTYKHTDNAPDEVTYAEYTLDPAPTDPDNATLSDATYQNRQKYLTAWTQKTGSHLPSAFASIASGYASASDADGDFLTANARGEYQMACDTGKLGTVTWNGSTQYTGAPDDTDNEYIWLAAVGGTDDSGWGRVARVVGSSGCGDQSSSYAGYRISSSSARFVVRP